jgi:hypothetical protein
MNKEDIKLIRQILRKNKRSDLVNLLSGAEGDIDESSTYGSYFFSTLSQYLFYLPLNNFHKARQLSDEDQKVLLDSVLYIYPHQAEAPEITSIDFRVLRKDNESEEKIKNEEGISQSPQQERKQEEIIKLFPEFYGVGVNLKVLWKKVRLWLQKL